MTENFNILKVSGEVKTNVANIISDGKVKNAADTKEEYQKLGELLSGANNPDDTGYIKSKMNEYTVKYKLSDLRGRASEYIQKMVDNIKSAFKPKKELNSDEADSLIAELKKAIAENRPNDAEYIREELHQAGFDDKLKAFDETCKKNVMEEEKAKEAKEAKTKEATAKEVEKNLKNGKTTDEPNTTEPNTTEPNVQKNNSKPKSKIGKKVKKPVKEPNIKDIPLPPKKLTWEDILKKFKIQ